MAKRQRLTAFTHLETNESTGITFLKPGGLIETIIGAEVNANTLVGK